MPDSRDGELARLRGELRAAKLAHRELELRNERLERRLAAERATAAHFAAQLGDLRNSRSWRITKPLRATMRRGRS